METTGTHEPVTAQRVWTRPPRGGDREQGSAWPAVLATLGSSAVGLAVGQLARGSRKPLARFIRAGAAVFSAASWVHLLFLRRWHLRWGATGEELRRAMPGDELVPHPHVETTRALTIAAPPEAVWPWLVQMGYRRGGWYSHDWLDNFGVPSARRIIPELQDLKVGDALAPIESGFVVTALDPPRSLVLVARGKNKRINTSWVFLLEPAGEGRSRFIERIRIAYDLSLGGLFWGLIFEPADFIMMRKQMLTLKRRAEQAFAAGAPDAAP